MADNKRLCWTIWLTVNLFVGIQAAAINNHYVIFSAEDYGKHT